MKKVMTKALASALIFALLPQSASAMAQLPFGLPNVEEEANEALIAQDLSAMATQEAQNAQALAQAIKSLAKEEEAEANQALMASIGQTASVIGQNAVAIYTAINQEMQNAPAEIRNMWNSATPEEQMAAIEIYMQTMALQQPLSQ